MRNVRPSSLDEIARRPPTLSTRERTSFKPTPAWRDSTKPSGRPTPSSEMLSGDGAIRGRRRAHGHLHRQPGWMGVFQGVGHDLREGERDCRGLRGIDDAMLRQRPLQAQPTFEHAAGLELAEQVGEHLCEVHVVLVGLPADRVMQPRNSEKPAVLQAQRVGERCARHHRRSAFCRLDLPCEQGSELTEFVCDAVVRLDGTLQRGGSLGHFSGGQSVVSHPPIGDQKPFSFKVL